MSRSTETPGPRRGAVALALALTAALIAPLSGCTWPGGGSGRVSVWVAEGERDIGADSPPETLTEIWSADSRAIRLESPIGATAPLQIALRASALPAGPFSIQVDDFVPAGGGAGALAARDMARVFRARYVRVESFRSWYREYAGRPIGTLMAPDVLVPWEAPRGGGPLVLDEPRTQIVWIDLRVPESAEPGDYRGRVELRRVRDGGTQFSAEIRLRVLPIRLPASRSLPLIARVDPRDLLAAHLRWPREPAEQTRILPSMASHAAAQTLIAETMRLLHDHRASPVLWASFPTIEPAGERDVRVDWTEYDALVAGFVDGDAYADRAPAEYWPMPASIRHPDAERNGGLGSPRYARLLAAYLVACQKHFAERGWSDRAFIRPIGPAPLSADTVERVRQAAGIVRQSERELALVAHLPPAQLRGLGWFNAPPIDLSDVSIWAVPAMWLEPAAAQRQRILDRRVWLMPDRPPYGAPLAVEAPASDARALPWIAYRYETDAIWLDAAAEFDRAAREPESLRPGLGEALIYPGATYGLPDRPVPSLRLKRLRRGLEDIELLRLLEKAGKPQLARSLAEQAIRWACTDACLDNLVTCKETGWPTDARVFGLARRLIQQELVNTFAPSAGGEQDQVAILSQWALFLSSADRIRATVSSVVLTPTPTGLAARVSCEVANSSNRAIEGQWRFPAPPAGWRIGSEPSVAVPPGARRGAAVPIDLGAISYNTDGVYPFSLLFDTAALGAFSVEARLAIAACPLMDAPPVVDGDLSDWGVASNNSAGDFRLVVGDAGEGAGRGGAPGLATRAFFCMDRERLYVGVWCELGPGEQPTWSADNDIPIDGAAPWGQDVVEILLDPQRSATGGGELYVLQFKPSGVMAARRGARTDPPMGPSEEWRSGAAIRVQTHAGAWTAEVAIPLAALPADARTNRVWGLNVTRHDARRGDYSSWSGARGHCYASASLGNLVLLRP